MDSSLRTILLVYIDAALDVDDLENIGDFVRSVLVSESMADWQMPDLLKKLHADLISEMEIEKNASRKVRIKAAISYIEADFTDYLINREIESLPNIS